MKKSVIPSIALAISISILSIAQASAATVPATPSATQIIAKSNTAITTRIASLNKLSAKITAFKHLTASQKTSLNSTIQASVTALNTLKVKIDGETDLTTLNADYASISADYRIYALVIPSTADIAATDTVIGKIATYQSTLATLHTRINDATTVGKSSSTVQASYADAVTKLADAQTQEQSMITAVTSLKPDMGNKTIQASNKTAIAAAKVDHKTLLSDLSAAQKDITAIRSGLATLKA